MNERMSYEQKCKIVDLRFNGKGYKSIASELGMTRDKVRKFCKYHCITNNGSRLSEDIRSGCCPVCGKRFVYTTSGRAKVFCSKQCYYKQRYNDSKV